MVLGINGWLPGVCRRRGVWTHHHATPALRHKRQLTLYPTPCAGTTREPHIVVRGKISSLHALGHVSTLADVTLASRRLLPHDRLLPFCFRLVVVLLHLQVMRWRRRWDRTIKRRHRRAGIKEVPSRPGPSPLVWRLWLSSSPFGCATGLLASIGDAIIDTEVDELHRPMHAAPASPA